MKAKHLIAIILIAVLTPILVMGVCAGAIVLISVCESQQFALYETDDIADYGTITGNRKDDTAEEFIFSFFPEALDESFSDITYHYTAERNSEPYTYEIYLEFVIKDPVEFSAFIQPYVDGSMPFIFDDSFMEQKISNQLRVHWGEKSEDSTYISNALMGKVMYSTKEQRVIFYALGVHDTHDADITEFGYFVDRFGINWVEFESTSDPQESIILKP